MIQGISLPAFPFRTNLKLRNIPVIPNLVKKLITNVNFRIKGNFAI